MSKSGRIRHLLVERYLLAEMHGMACVSEDSAMFAGIIDAE